MHLYVYNLIDFINPAITSQRKKIDDEKRNRYKRYKPQYKLQSRKKKSGRCRLLFKNVFVQREIWGVIRGNTVDRITSNCSDLKYIKPSHPTKPMKRLKLNRNKGRLKRLCCVLLRDILCDP